VFKSLGRVSRGGVRPRPGLGLEQQRAELLEQVGSGCVRTIELLDPLEPRQHRTHLVHSVKVPRRVERL
jgi:hypothetical protein